MPPPDASAASALGASSIAAPAAAPTGGGGGGRRGVQGLLLVTLRDRRDRGRRVVVACVHLKAKEGAANDAARAAQAREAVRALEEEANRPGEEAAAGEAEREQEGDAEERRRRQAGSGGGDSPTSPSSPPPRPPATVAILAGDFNAEPGSAPHEAVRASGLPLRCLWECEREEDEGDGEEATAAAASSGGSGGNGAPTAAAKAKGSASNNRLPPYTTYKFRSEDSESDASDGSTRGREGARAGGGAERNDKATTTKSGNSTCTDQLCRRVSDFVFFTPRSAAAVERWAPLDFERDVRDGLPCERYPSDHAAVLAVLRPK